MANASVTQVKPNKKVQTTTLKTEMSDVPSREEMISVAAYYHAEHRGYSGGNQMGDWLTAESEIDAMHNNHKILKTKGIAH